VSLPSSTGGQCEVQLFVDDTPQAEIVERFREGIFISNHVSGSTSPNMEPN
jgi:hypothetical protein